MFHSDDKGLSSRALGLSGAIVAVLLSSCAQRSSTPSATAATVTPAQASAELPEVVVIASREHPQRWASQSDSRKRDRTRREIVSTPPECRHAARILERYISTAAVDVPHRNDPSTV